MNKIDTLLYEFLVEENGMPDGEFRLLTEEVKTETIVQIANEIMSGIQSKMSDIDTISIDRTRGEIKNFTELGTIQDTISRLTSLISQYTDEVSPLLGTYLKEIIKALNNLNKYSNYYREAYRSKKTLTIMSYQSIILSIISCLSYVVSAVVDFKDVVQLKIKKNADLIEILPLQTIKKFNSDIDSGAYNSLLKDVNMLREFYTEYNVEQLQTIYEAVAIVDLLRDGLNTFTRDLTSRNSSGILFKVIGIIMIILSLRDVFYTLSNSRIKIAEKLQGLKTFLNIGDLSSVYSLGRFITFNNKNAAESVYMSDAAKKEIASENKEIIMNSKNAPSNFEVETEFIPEKESNPEVLATTPATNTDIFSGFNF